MSDIMCHTSEQPAALPKLHSVVSNAKGALHHCMNGHASVKQYAPSLRTCSSTVRSTCFVQGSRQPPSCIYKPHRFTAATQTHPPFRQQGWQWVCTGHAGIGGLVLHHLTGIVCSGHAATPLASTSNTLHKSARHNCKKEKRCRSANKFLQSIKSGRIPAPVRASTFWEQMATVMQMLNKAGPDRQEEELDSAAAALRYTGFFACVSCRTQPGHASPASTGACDTCFLCRRLPWVTRRELLRSAHLRHFAAGERAPFPSEETFFCILAGSATIVEAGTPTPDATCQAQSSSVGEASGLSVAVQSEQSQTQAGTGAHSVEDHRQRKLCGSSSGSNPTERSASPCTEQSRKQGRRKSVAFHADTPPCSAEASHASAPMREGSAPLLLHPCPDPADAGAMAASTCSAELRAQGSVPGEDASQAEAQLMNLPMASLTLKAAGSSENVPVMVPTDSTISQLACADKAAEHVIRVVGSGDVWGVGEDAMEVCRGPRSAVISVDTDVAVITAAQLDDILQVGQHVPPSAREIAMISPILAQLTPAEMAVLLDGALVQSFPAGVQLLSADEAPQCAVLVLRGTCHLATSVLQRGNDADKPVPVREESAGGLLGFAGALFDVPLWAAAITSTSATVLTIPSQALRAISDGQDAAAVKGVSALQQTAFGYEKTLRVDAVTSHSQALAAGSLPFSQLGVTMAELLNSVSRGCTSAASAAGEAPFPVLPVTPATRPSTTGSHERSPRRSMSPSMAGPAPSALRQSRYMSAALAMRRSTISPAEDQSSATSVALPPEAQHARRALLDAPVAAKTATTAAASEKPKTVLGQVLDMHAAFAVARPAATQPGGSRGERGEGAAAPQDEPQVPDRMKRLAAHRDAAAKRQQQELQAAYDASYAVLDDCNALRIEVPYVAEPSGANWHYVPEQAEPDHTTTALQSLGEAPEADVAVSRRFEHGLYRMPAVEVVQNYIDDRNSVAARMVAQRSVPHLEVHQIASEEYKEFWRRQQTVDTRSDALHGGFSAADVDGLAGVGNWVGMWKATKVGYCSDQLALTCEL